MHKKLEAELVSLAHSILQMKNKDDINALHEKAHVIYEKLSVLKFVEDYINTTPQTEQSKEAIIERIEDNLADEQEDEQVIEPIEEPVEMPEVEDFIPEEAEEEPQEEEEDFTEEAVSEPIEMAVPEQVLQEEESPEVEEDEEVIEETTQSETPQRRVHDLFEGQISLEDELQRAYESDEAASLFEKVTKEHPVVEEEQPEPEPDIELEPQPEIIPEPESVIEPEPEQKRSLNDALFKNHIQVGLNDRIAFVKHLFNNSQEDFNRVLSQLNSFDTEKEAKTFINKIVRPDYDWTGKEDYEQRLIELVERKFM